jgi:7-carboxy-7-deazaguanine synthase
LLERKTKNKESIILTIEKHIPVITTTTTLPVMESFYTLQGEGHHAGKAAYFIRLGGCNVGCVWCDVKESWDASAHPQLSIEQIIEKAREESNGGRPEVMGKNRSGLHQPSNIAVVTGGEPLLHNLDELTTALHYAGFQTNIETSGSAPLSGLWDWICLSPKKFKAPLPENLPLANELKVVVYNKTDFAWAEQHAAQTAPDCKLYLQAEWSRRHQMMPLMVDYIKANPQWQLSLQVHKYIDVP